MFDSAEQRKQYLTQWAMSIDSAARAGAFSNGTPIEIAQIELVSGPRAGALKIDAGLKTGSLLRTMSADDGAVLRQFVPYDFVGEPGAFMLGRHLQIEAGWSEDLAQSNIRVSELNARPDRHGHWLAGMNENGRPVILHINENAAHFLISGTTGSGKSVCLRSTSVQLSDRGDMLIFIDGKFGDGLKHLDRLTGAVGPIADEVETARAALGYAVKTMIDRYKLDDRERARLPFLCIVIDEVQELITDVAIGEMIRKLAAQGRAVNVSLFLATQHPSTKALGDDPTIKRNVTARVAMKVADQSASQVAVGQPSPRADRLLGKGDAYVVTTGSVHRVQIAYMTEGEIGRKLHASPQFSVWPPFDPSIIESGQQLPAGSAGFAPQEIAASITCSAREMGRPSMLKMLEMRDGDRARKLYKLGREVHSALERQGMAVCLSGPGDTPMFEENDQE